MPNKNLVGQNIARVQAASSTSIKLAAQSIRPSDESWGISGNSFISDPTGSIHSLAEGDLNQDAVAYAAASVPVHCLDGWKYLGNAVRCALYSSLQQAMHMAYYAELRAATAILAYHGVAIFNTEHLTFDVAGNVYKVKNRKTHAAIAESLEIISQKNEFTTLLGNGVALEGVGLSEWTAEFTGSPLQPSLGAEWMASWGVDFQNRVLHEDKQIRNDASYLPSMKRSRRISHREMAKPLIGLRRMLVPLSGDVFVMLDRILVRRALQRMYMAVKSDTERSDDYSERIRQTVSQLGLSGGELGTLLTEFLIEDTKESRLLDLSMRRPSLRASYLDAMSMMARALLLLRVASIAADDVLREMAVSPTDIRTVLAPLARATGAVGYEEDLEDPLDLVADVEVAIEDLDTAVTSWSKGEGRLLQEHARDFQILSNLEMLGVWSLSH